jgi:hypothetical protein
LYRFHGESDGESPLGGLLFDELGNLYGATAYGGDCGSGSANGTAFELTRMNGAWNKRTLHSFCGFQGGEGPTNLIFDRGGNLYGPACRWLNRMGVVFRLNRFGVRGWTETVLHTFTQQEGYAGITTLTVDGAGNLYGSGNGGGTNDAGTV